MSGKRGDGHSTGAGSIRSFFVPIPKRARVEAENSHNISNIVPIVPNIIPSIENENNDILEPCTVNNQDNCDVAVATTMLEPETVRTEEQGSLRNDVGTVLGQTNIPDHRKFELLKAPWKPAPNFVFPKKDRNLSFQFKWLFEFPWLVYSHAKQGALCLYCVLFSQFSVGRAGSQPGKLATYPLVEWRKALQEFRGHEIREYHLSAKEKASNFLAVNGKVTVGVNVQLNRSRMETIEKNRKILKSIIKTILFCGQQGLPLRVHRDSGIMDVDLSEPTENDGNFRALLRFRVEAGDDFLAHHLRTCARNAMYVSPEIQNTIISCCNDLIVRRIVDDVNASKSFAILCDETTSVATVEQLTFCVRFYDSKLGKLREEFLQFFPVTDLTGEGLSKAILKGAESLGLVLKFLHGQGYDGAAAMKGQFQGCQTRVKALYPLAIYVHCSAHCLNLAISDTCKIAAIRNCLGIISKTTTFFGTPKRLDALKSAINRVCPSSNHTRLQQFVATRWVEKHTTIDIFSELFEAIVAALTHISENWSDRQSSSDAHCLLSSLLKCDFVLTLFVVQKLFNLSLPLSRYLQTKNIDLTQAVTFAEEVLFECHLLRADTETQFKILFDEAATLCESLDVEIKVPRTTGRQTHRSNISADSPFDYFKVSVFIPFVDSYIMELTSRFVDHKLTLCAFQGLLNTQQNERPSQDQIDGFKELFKNYAADFESFQMSEAAAVAELTVWFRRLKTIRSQAKNEEEKRNLNHALYLLSHCDQTMFPVLSKLLQILVTLPVSTTTAERSFSTLKRLQTYLRSTMAEDRLNGLANLNIHREILLDPELILDEFAKDKRRLDFSF